MLCNNRKSFIAFLFCCLFLTSVSFYTSKWNAWESQKLITWDLSGYYMYLPGIFYDDLGKLNNRQYIIDQYHPCGDELYEHVSPIGKYVIKYSCGMAIMYLPGFFAGHLYAKIANYPVDGFSYPYQFCMAMYSLLISFLGLWVTRKLLLKYFSDGVTGLAILSIVLATNYLNYAAISNMFPHNYLFTLYALLIYLSILWHKDYGYGKSILMGVLCGLAALSRPTEIISIVIPLLWGVGSLSSLKERFRVLYTERKKTVLLFLTPAIVGSVQLIYWKVYAGKFVYWSYGDDDGLNFFHPHVLNVLFSYKKGWFIYTPFMILSVLGFIPLYRKQKELFWLSLVFLSIAFYLVFSWKTWAYGGSFTMRAVIQYYAVLIFPLTAFFEYAFNSWKLFLSTGIYFIFCVWLNLAMTYQANGADIMESDNMSKTYYWKIFGRLKVDKRERKFIDTDEEIPKKKVPFLKPLVERIFCSDSSDFECTEFKNVRAFVITKDVDFLPETRIDVSGKKDSWYRVTCDAYIEKREGNYWTQPLLYAWLSDENFKNMKQKSYRIQRVASFTEWDKFSIDIKVPFAVKGKYLRAGIYNPKGDVKVYVRSLQIEYVEE